MYLYIFFVCISVEYIFIDPSSPLCFDVLETSEDIVRPLFTRMEISQYTELFMENLNVL